jgi:hypothetical protein
MIAMGFSPWIQSPKRKSASHSDGSHICDDLHDFRSIRSCIAHTTPNILFGPYRGLKSAATIAPSLRDDFSQSRNARGRG